MGQCECDYGFDGDRESLCQWNDLPDMFIRHKQQIYIVRGGNDVSK